MQEIKAGLTLKTARERKGYTQGEAAKLIGVSPDTLSNYERGKSYPDVPILRKSKKFMVYHMKDLFFYLWITIKP